MTAASLTATLAEPDATARRGPAGTHVSLVIAGAWTAERAAELERIVVDGARRCENAKSVDIDLEKLERLDTFGAWLIERRRCARGASAAASRRGLDGLARPPSRAVPGECRHGTHRCRRCRRRGRTASSRRAGAVGRTMAEGGRAMTRFCCSGSTRRTGAGVPARACCARHTFRFVLARASSRPGRLARCRSSC